MLHLKKGLLLLLLTTQLLDAGLQSSSQAFVMTKDAAWTAPEGNRQVCALEPQAELSARDEEISEQTHYPYIHLLQCFLAGISEQLLQEPRQSSGWVQPSLCCPSYTLAQAAGTGKLHT